jgi:nitrite reductase/ring-hydroxylating ferredoxin subunit
MFVASGITRGELQAKRKKLVRRDGRQVLLIAAEGRVFAIANRCPHEGYPLSEGSLAGCVLTCNWHNWKFDLRSGETLVGSDPVRTYPVEERSGEIFVDLADPPAEAQRQRALHGLEAAIADNDASRMAREMARLERAGFDAKIAVAHAVAARNDFLEEGTTHAYAAAADWLALADRAPSRQARLAALIEPVGHIAWDTQGAEQFPYHGEIANWNAAALVGAIENENEPAALAFIRGAPASGASLDDVLSALSEAALAHYADFGHSAIYTLKARQIIERLGDGVAEPILFALARSLILATREDHIPEFRGYARALAAWDGSGDAPARAEDFFGLTIDGILKRTLESSGRPARELYDALLGAAAWSQLHFDEEVQHAVDNAIADNINWLDFTHALTFANAVRHICDTRPYLWPRAALQMALFAGRNKKYVDAGQDTSRWRVNDRESFIAREMDALYDHGIPEPIIACHRLKVTCALEDELSAAPDAPWANTMLAATNRYLNTPVKRHHGLRNATQALDFIAKEG